MAIDEQRGRRAVDETSIDTTVKKHQPFAEYEVARLRRVNRDKSPAELLDHVTKHYLRNARSIGKAAGRAAAAQGAPVRSTADSDEFKQVSALHVLKVAEIHGLDPEDFERRSQLVEAVLNADMFSRAATSEPVRRTVKYLAKTAVDRIPMTAIKAANGILGHHRYLTKRGKLGVVILDELLFDALRLGVGAGGYHLSGGYVIWVANRILDPLPATWEDLQADDGDPSS
ncbi:hypothetical protein ACX80V_16725 [Arthrobacter sp. MDT3-24]